METRIDFYVLQRATELRALACRLAGKALRPAASASASIRAGRGDRAAPRPTCCGPARRSASSRTARASDALAADTPVTDRLRRGAAADRDGAAQPGDDARRILRALRAAVRGRRPVTKRTASARASATVLPASAATRSPTTTSREAAYDRASDRR